MEYLCRERERGGYRDFCRSRGEYGLRLSGFAHGAHGQVEVDGGVGDEHTALAGRARQKRELKGPVCARGNRLQFRIVVLAPHQRVIDGLEKRSLPLYRVFIEGGPCERQGYLNIGDGIGEVILPRRRATDARAGGDSDVAAAFAFDRNVACDKWTLHR